MYQIAFYRESSQVSCSASRTPHGSQISSHLLEYLRLVSTKSTKHRWATVNKI